MRGRGASAALRLLLLGTAEGIRPATAFDGAGRSTQLAARQLNCESVFREVLSYGRVVAVPVGLAGIRAVKSLGGADIAALIWDKIEAMGK